MIRDLEALGVFLKAEKSSSWNPYDFKDIELYSMVLGKRTREIVDQSKPQYKGGLRLGLMVRLERCENIGKRLTCSIA